MPNYRDDRYDDRSFDRRPRRESDSDERFRSHDDDYDSGGPGPRYDAGWRPGQLRRPLDSGGQRYRDRYDRDYATGAVGRGGESSDYDNANYDSQGRSLYEEGRDYFRRHFGRQQEHGPSRSHVRCRDIMTRDVTVATRDTTLQQVAQMMRDEDTGVIPVVDHDNGASSEAGGGAILEESRRVNSRIGGNGKLAGLVTDRDVVVRAVAEGKDFHATRVADIMTTDVHTAAPNDRVIDAIRKMGDKQVRRIPVVDKGGNLRGIISLADIALETEEDRELAHALEEISSGSSFWNKIFG